MAFNELVYLFISIYEMENKLHTCLQLYAFWMIPIPLSHISLSSSQSSIPHPSVYGGPLSKTTQNYFLRCINLFLSLRL